MRAVRILFTGEDGRRPYVMVDTVASATPREHLESPDKFRNYAISVALKAMIASPKYGDAWVKASTHEVHDIG